MSNPGNNAGNEASPLASVNGSSIIGEGTQGEAGSSSTDGVGKSRKSIADSVIRDGSQLVNGELKPNAIYQTGEHNYIYKTNDDGLIINASTDRLLIKVHGGRLNHNPNTYGKMAGDQAGHLIGDRFGGSPELDNLVSQARNVNQSGYKVLENHWANALKNGYKVTVDITVQYVKGSARPVSFDVLYTIDGIPFFWSTSNYQEEEQDESSI